MNDPDKRAAPTRDTRTGPKKPTGTREWAAKNVNLALGCEHNCRYCYARADARRFGRIKGPDEWRETRLIEKTLAKSWGLSKGTIMFPTAHDIVPAILDPCVEVLRRMLKAGNRVLIVSKPHLTCIERLSTDLKAFKDQILFRFTIGSLHGDVLGFWEPSAPSFGERLAALKLACERSYRTSVSAEPFLDEDIRELFHAVAPWVTDSIWIGPMNRMEQRVSREGWTEADQAYWERVKRCQTRSEIERLFQDLKDEPRVRWKNAVKEMLGLPTPAASGLDI